MTAAANATSWDDQGSKDSTRNKHAPKSERELLNEFLYSNNYIRYIEHGQLSQTKRKVWRPDSIVVSLFVSMIGRDEIYNWSAKRPKKYSDADT